MNLQLLSPLLVPLLLLLLPCTTTSTTTTTDAAPTCTAASDTTTTTLTASKGASSLGIRLLQQLGKENNALISPYSVWMVLTLLDLGAEGQTDVQLRQVLGLEGKAGVLSLLRNFEDSLLSKAQQDLKITFSSANRIYYDEKFSIKQCRNELLDYLAPVNIVDQPTEAANTINRFVNDTTKGLIPEVIKPSLLTPDTRMVAVNGVYFKGDWTYPFPVNNTAPASFFPDGGEPTTVPTMVLTDARVRTGYSKAFNASILQLPYSSGTFKMSIILPDKGAFRATLASLSADAIWRSLETLKDNIVDIHLPKFEIRSEFSEEIKRALQKFGVKDLFSRRSANLSSFSEGLFVKYLIHKTVVKVDEKGTEAAGATGAVIVTKINKVLRVNRSFLFMIHDDDTILFAGTVKKP